MIYVGSLQKRPDAPGVFVFELCYFKNVVFVACNHLYWTQNNQATPNLSFTTAAKGVQCQSK